MSMAKLIQLLTTPTRLVPADVTTPEKLIAQKSLIASNFARRPFPASSLQCLLKTGEPGSPANQAIGALTAP